MPFSQVLQRGQPVFVDNCQEAIPILPENGTGKWPAAIPLVSKGRVVGALNVASCKRAFFSPEEKNILELIGKEAGTLVSKLQTEAALRESEKYYRTLIDTSPDIIVVMDLDARLITVNQQFLKIGGYFYDEVIGAMHLRFRLPGSIATFLAKRPPSSSKKGRPSGSDYLFRKKDGQAVPLEVSAGLLYDGAGRPMGIIAIGRDISERKRAEQELRESKALLDAVVENVPLMIFLKEATDLKFVIFNRAGKNFWVIAAIACSARTIWTCSRPSKPLSSWPRTGKFSIGQPTCWTSRKSPS